MRATERPVSSEALVDQVARSDGPDMSHHASEASPLTGAAELFHQLNNQLGIILANAELLELKARDDTSRDRAAQVVSSVLEALQTARSLRKRVDS